MWLLNTFTHKLEHFLDDRRVTYATLSHCWEDDEVSFEDVQRASNVQHADLPQSSQGWRKIKAACRLAQQDGFEFIWIDTCAIDKSSSAELSEAINSMYRWYQNAKVCYTYLYDVIEKKDFVRAKYWTRGWTLQELIAPQTLFFYDTRWQRLGSREAYSVIIEATFHIPSSLLRGEASVDTFSVAQRMSWASARETTRAEDMAYSLMGMFGVNMPMLYGEGGERAFLRLQEEIIKYSTDQTIFAWRTSDDATYRGLLAHSPSEFEGCGQVEQIEGSEDVTFQQTNGGLRIALRAYPHTLNVYYAELLAKQAGHPIGIFLGFPLGTALTDRVGRIHPRFTSGRILRTVTRRQFIVPRYPFVSTTPSDPLSGFHIRSFRLSDIINDVRDHRVQTFARGSAWDATSGTISETNSIVGCVVAFALPITSFALKEDSATWWVFLKLGFTAQFEPWLWLFPPARKNAPLNLSTLISKASKARISQAPGVAKRIYDISYSRAADKSVLEECGATADRVLAASPDVMANTPNYHVGQRAKGLVVEYGGIVVQVWLDGDPQAWTVDIQESKAPTKIKVLPERSVAGHQSWNTR